MPVDVAAAMNAYGYVEQLAAQIPELHDILAKAISTGATQGGIDAAIESSPWWRTHADTVRNLAQMEATDPASYHRNMLNAENLIQLKANSLGRTLDVKTRQALALQTLTTNAGWDDQVLTNLVATKTQLHANSSGAYTGNAADLVNHMTQTAQSYGVAYTPDQLNRTASIIQQGGDSLSGWENLMRARAKATYPQFANQIDAGMTVRDIADPYISTMASTLELDANTVTLKDPSIQKALSQRDPTGAATSQPMWQFQQQVKADPRYDKTTQARDDAFTALKQIGADFGFAPGGKATAAP